MTSFAAPYAIVAMPVANELEKKWLEKAEAKRCNECKHPTIYHNTHCCLFCMVTDCQCSDDGENGSYSNE